MLIEQQNFSLYEHGSNWIFHESTYQEVGRKDVKLNYIIIKLRAQKEEMRFQQWAPMKSKRSAIMKVTKMSKKLWKKKNKKSQD